MSDFPDSMFLHCVGEPDEWVCAETPIYETDVKYIRADIHEALVGELRELHANMSYHDLNPEMRRATKRLTDILDRHKGGDSG